MLYGQLVRIMDGKSPGNSTEHRTVGKYLPNTAYVHLQSREAVQKALGTGKLSRTVSLYALSHTHMCPHWKPKGFVACPVRSFVDAQARSMLAFARWTSFPDTRATTRRLALMF
jgi:hypothetical protein